MRTLWTALLIPVLALSLATGLVAASKREPAGVILTLSGKVTLYPSTSATPLPKTPRLGWTVYAGDRLKTGNNGRVALVLTDGTHLKLNYNTDITLSNRNSKGRTSARGIAAIKILIGDLWAKVTKRDSTLEFDTPGAVAAVKGTEPLISVGADGTTCVQLRSGKVFMSNELPGGVTLHPDQQICVSEHQRISSGLVQPWTSTTPTWEQSFNQASQATVTISYTDRGGGARILVLNYATDVTGSAQSLTGSAK